MANIPDNVEVEGRWGTIKYAIRRNGKMPAKEFIESLDKADGRKINVLFKRMAETGRIFNKEKFSKLEGYIFEFKSYQVRALCFQKSNNWILTHGFIKKKGRTPRKEIKKAEDIMDEHLEVEKERGE